MTLLVLFAVMGCSGGAASEPETPPVEEVADPLPALQLIESWPVETTLDQPDIDDAHTAWLELIGSAKTSLDIAQFYISPNPDAEDRMDPVLEAVYAAAARGVKVRVLGDAKFNETYPDDLARLGATENIEVRIYDMKPVSGGVMHAKYFLVDGRTAYLGSQNFDWRSLEHIVELGVRFEGPAVSELKMVFDQDWSLAIGGEPAKVEAQQGHAMVWRGNEVTVDFVESPKSLAADWDLPKLLALIDGAESMVQIHLLSYAVRGYDKTDWHELDKALRAAGERGVLVQLLVSNWQKSKYKQGVVKELTAAKNVEVRFINIPEHSSGWIDFGRTIHSKYMVVDHSTTWLGTSNWSKDYFHSSRNVGLIVSGIPFADRVSGLHEQLWASEYAEAVDPAKTYVAPYEAHKAKAKKE